MAAIIKQSTAYNRVFKMCLRSDHVTGATGLTLTCTLSKNAASFAAAGGTISEIANGFYYIQLTTTDTNTLGDLAYHIISSTGSPDIVDPTDFVDQVRANVLGDAMTLTSAYDFAKGTTAVSESYAANGVAPTPVQALLAIHQMLMSFSITSTTLAVKRLDNSTSAFNATLNSSSAPTQITRS